jgi:hypothetical protein
MFDGQR